MKAHINGIEMFYEDTGRGIPVLWIHGYPLDHSVWLPQVRALDDCARHILPDLRGFGETDAPAEVYTMDMYAADLRGLMDHLKIKQAIVAGLSMGGYIALAFARRCPQYLLGLILADTRAGPDTAEAAKTRRENAAKARREGVAPVVEPMLEKLFAQAKKVEQPALVQTLRKLLLSSRPDGVAGALLGMAERPDSTPDLPNITVPTLVIVGAEDVITPPKESQQMAAAIPNAQLVEIPRAGHLANLENPAAFNRAVREFLGKPLA